MVYTASGRCVMDRPARYVNGIEEGLLMERERFMRYIGLIPLRVTR